VGLSRIVEVGVGFPNDGCLVAEVVRLEEGAHEDGLPVRRDEEGGGALRHHVVEAAQVEDADAVRHKHRVVLPLGHDLTESG